MMVLSKNAALTHAKRGIRVSAMMPGMEMPMVSALTPEGVTALIATTPLGRLGEPEEIASIVGHLAWDESNFATGVPSRRSCCRRHRPVPVEGGREG